MKPACRNGCGGDCPIIQASFRMLIERFFQRRKRSKSIGSLLRATELGGTGFNASLGQSLLCEMPRSNPNPSFDPSILEAFAALSGSHPKAPVLPGDTYSLWEAPRRPSDTKRSLMGYSFLSAANVRPVRHSCGRLPNLRTLFMEAQPSGA